MRRLAGLTSVMALLALTPTADAKEKADSRKVPMARTASTHVAAPQIETHDCVRANGVDPAGNYKGFPCWARAAFGPESRR